MKKCLNCGRDISNKHPNAKFCSNKGRGNCKDKFHNRANPRGYGRGLSTETEYENDIHPHDPDALGQWL